MLISKIKIKRLIRNSLNEAVDISLVKEVQKNLGVDDDGDWGPLTDAAWYEWCKKNSITIAMACHLAIEPNFTGPPDKELTSIMASGNIKNIASSDIGKMIGEKNSLMMISKLMEIPTQMENPTTFNLLKNIFIKGLNYIKMKLNPEDTNVNITDDKLEIPDLDYTLDETKLKRYRKVDLNSVHKMSKATGLRPDFVFGIQARESAGIPNAMALNPHISLSYSINKRGIEIGYTYASELPKYAGGKGSKGYILWKTHAEQARKRLASQGYSIKSIPGVTNQGFNHPAYEAMKSVDNDLAILGNALGYYQVLGFHLMPKYNYSGAAIESAFLADPKKFGQDAFIIWVNKHSKGSNSFRDKCNAGEANWFDQISRYYGKPFPEYVDYVKAAAAAYRAAKIPKRDKFSELMSS